MLEKAEDIVRQVTQVTAPLCHAEGMELVHVEYQYEPGGLILRIYIDKPGGVVLDDCVVISRQLNDLLDIHLEERCPPYSLEVSSPGTDRPLSRPEDYDRFKGEVARIKTKDPIEKRKNFKGVIMGVVDGNIAIKVQDHVFSIPFKRIQRGRLVDYNGEK